MSAYRYGSFDKIREFTKLRDRLSNSQHFVSVSIEKKLLDLMRAETHPQTVQLMSLFEVDPLKDFLVTSDLVDNRDFSPMPSWEISDRYYVVERS